MARAYLVYPDRIDTQHPDGYKNGWVKSIVNTNPDQDGIGYPIGQVYITACYENSVKGPHVHDGNKTDKFFCIEGKCVIVCKDTDGNIQEFVLEGRTLEGPVLVIPPGVAHAIKSLNIGCVVLSVTSEGYNKNEPYNQREVTYEGYDWEQWF